MLYLHLSRLNSEILSQHCKLSYSLLSLNVYVVRVKGDEVSRTRCVYFKVKIGSGWCSTAEMDTRLVLLFVLNAVKINLKIFSIFVYYAMLSYLVNTTT